MALLSTLLRQQLLAYLDEPAKASTDQLGNCFLLPSGLSQPWLQGGHEAGGCGLDGAPAHLCGHCEAGGAPTRQHPLRRLGQRV